jgi:predicted permease
MTFASVIALATSLLFGLVPALRATRLSLNNEIKGGGRNSGPERLRLAKTLVVAQVALSLVLLVGAGLFTRTLRNLQRVELGFNRTHLILFGINGMAAGHDRAQVAALYARMHARLAALPGILGATFSQVPTLGREMVGTGIEIPATAARTEQRVVVPSNGVGPDYFSTLELPLLAGRTFQPMDFTPDAKVVIVNQAFARRYFGADNALGGRTSAGEIVGVVRDAHYADAREVLGPIAYVPFQHYPMDDGLPSIDAANFVVRTEANPQSVLASLRLVVRAIDPTLALFNVRTLDEQVARLLQQERLFARLSGCFGALAAALVCVGLYGLMSFAVLQRTGEIGIRMALGALPREVLWMVVRESLALVALGVGFGLAGATAASRLLRTLLFGVEPNDLVTFVAVALLLPSVAVVACWLPARRASNVDPMVALRCE